MKIITAIDASRDRDGTPDIKFIIFDCGGNLEAVQRRLILAYEPLPRFREALAVAVEALTRIDYEAPVSSVGEHSREALSSIAAIINRK
jgi:hypothetical protein